MEVRIPVSSKVYYKTQYRKRCKKNIQTSDNTILLSTISSLWLLLLLILFELLLFWIKLSALPLSRFLSESKGSRVTDEVEVFN